MSSWPRSWCLGLVGGTVVVVVVPVVAPGVVSPITSWAWLMAACIGSMSVWNCARLSALRRLTLV